MSGWSRVDLRVRRCAWLLSAALTVAGCAEVQSGAPATPTARGAADDSDLWNLAPGAADTVADVDLAALRASLWTRALTQTDLSGQREHSVRAFGYDPFTDGDRLLAIAVEAGGAPHNLTVLRGRFDPGRIATAFTSANAHVTSTRWRDSPIWDTGEHAVALVTPRTVVSGSSADVRAAIDAAWGIVPDARSGPLGELRREMGADRDGQAAFVAVNLTETLRARAAGFVALPAGLQRFAARLNLGEDLNVDFTGVADNAADAAATARAVTTAAHEYAEGTMIRLLGLAPILRSIAVGAEGARLHGHVNVPVEQRERLAEKLLAVLQMVAAAHH
ncbi:MAG TPA: hypothetical protein VLT58_07210 [Polyangia bacterium]|nr:hypothetical protein [Polyangia bacterium]